jgi:rhombotail lipoprotein
MKPKPTTEDSFQNAVADMIVNLEDEMRQFKERLAKEKTATITYRTGYTGGGGGSVGWSVLLLALIFGSRRLKYFLPGIFQRL